MSVAVGMIFIVSSVYMQQQILLEQLCDKSKSDVMSFISFPHSRFDLFLYDLSLSSRHLWLVENVSHQRKLT